MIAWGGAVWYVSIMSNCDWLTRIATTKAKAAALACRFGFVATVLLLFGFVPVYPACAKEEPRYVGDFPDNIKRQNIQIIDDGPVLHQFRDAPSVVPSSPAMSAKPESQRRISRLGEQYDAAKENSKKRGPAIAPQGPIGDFPLPKLNFPREIGPAGKPAIPMTASPSMIHVPAKPMRASGAVQKGDVSRLRKPTYPNVDTKHLQTYRTGYVPGSTSTVGESKGPR